MDPRFQEIQELHNACRDGNVDRVTALLKSHPQVLDTPDHDDRFFYPESCIWSPLGIAARHGHEKLVAALLDMGANPVPYEFAGQYHQHTYWDWTKQLRERGYLSISQAILSAIERRYGTLLDEANIRQAVLEGKIDRVQALLAEKPDRIRQIDAVANTPLHIAVASNNLAMTRLLIESGSAIDAVNADGRTPAVVALFGLHRWWRNEEKPEILDLLLQKGARYSTLIAATIGDEDRVRQLLQSDPSLANAPDPCFRRPLSGAASNGHTAIVKLLLENGADPNAKEAVCQGGYSLHLAAWKNYIEIVQLLLDRGAIPEHWMDSSGDSLFAAYHRGNKDVLHLLYSYGGTMELKVYAAAHRIDVIAEVLKVDPSKADQVLPYGWDDGGSEDAAYGIMRLAIRYGARFENASEWNLRWTVSTYPKVFRLLQEHGANPDQPLFGIAGDERRRYKSAEAQLRVIRFLVEECGANVNCRGEDGLTPLAVAARAGHADIAEYLLSKGADLDPDGASWMKPLALAEQRGHKPVIDLLRNNSAGRG